MTTTTVANLDWLYHLLGYSLAGAATFLLLWALFWDRSRGRKRCPRCWYDMSGAPGLTCPECGRTCKNDRRLVKTRRRWRFAVPSLAVLLAAHVVWSVPGIQRFGWPWLIPSPVLAALWPLDIQVWLDNVHLSPRKPNPDPVLEEWLRRCGDGEFSEWSAALWTHRVKRYWNRPGEPEGSNVIFIGHLIRAAQAFEDPPLAHCALDAANSPPPVANLSRFEASGTIALTVRDCIDPGGWASNGGDRGEIVELAPWLLVRSTPEVAHEVRALIDALRDASGQLPRAISPDWIRLNETYDSLQPYARGLTPEATIWTALEQMHAATGVHCAIQGFVPDGNLTLFDPAWQADFQHARWLQVLNACVDRLNADLRPRCDWLIRDGQVLITNRLDGQWVARGRSIRVYNVNDLCTSTQTRRDEAVGELIVAMRDSIDPEGWVENGGDRSFLFHLADRFVISALPEHHAAIESFLNQRREHPTTQDR